MAILIVALLGGLALAQPAEQKPVRALLEGLHRADDLTLAGVLLPGLRRGTAATDADAVLSYALGRSEISFLTADWLRRLGPTSGTSMTFEAVTVTTTAKTNDTAVVHVRGMFAPTNDNPLIRLVPQGLRQTFDADVAVACEGGTWYVTSSTARPSPLPNTRPPAVDSRPTTTPPAIGTVPAVVVRHLAPGTYAAPPSASVADIKRMASDFA